MLAFSNDYYGMIFRATQSVELFCAYDIPTSSFYLFRCKIHLIAAPPYNFWLSCLLWTILHISASIFYGDFSNFQQFFFYNIHFTATFFQTMRIVFGINRQSVSKRFPVYQLIMIKCFIVWKHSLRTSLIKQLQFVHGILFWQIIPI